MSRFGFHSTWNYYIDVMLEEIANLYGPTIHDSRIGKNWDVGQAVCAEQFGTDWMNHPEFHRINEMPPEERIDPGITDAAQRLIDGVDWCKKLEEAE
jgi:hypothetical protein